MTRLQKQASYALGVQMAALAACAVVLLATGNPMVATAGFSIMALQAFVQLIGNTDVDPKQAPIPAKIRWQLRLAVVAGAAVWALLEWRMRNGLPTAGLALILAMVWLFRHASRPVAWGLAAYDEREGEVITRACLVAGYVLWVVFVAGSMCGVLFAPMQVPRVAFGAAPWVGLWVMSTSAAVSVLWREWSWQS